MQAVILAGGLGTRLRSVVGESPKPMAPILGKPFLEYQLRYLRRQGICDCVLCVGYRAETIRDYFGDGARLGMALRYAVETEARGTGGALKNAETMLEESFLALNGDTFAQGDYAALMREHKVKGAAATLVLTWSEDGRASGNVELDREGAITAFMEKRAAAQGAPAWLSAGVYALERRVVAEIPEGRAVSLEYETFPQLIERGAGVLGVKWQGYFVDIGTPETIRRFESDVIGGLVDVDP